HWHIDIMTEEQARKVREAERAEIYKIPMLPAGMAEKFLLGGLTTLRSIVYKGAEFIKTMHNLSEEDANALIEYCKKRQDELDAERAAAQAAAQAQAGAPKVPVSASPDEPVGAGVPAGEAAAGGATPAAAEKGGAQ